MMKSELFSNGVKQIAFSPHHDNNLIFGVGVMIDEYDVYSTSLFYIDNSNPMLTNNLLIFSLGPDRGLDAPQIYSMHLINS